MNVEPVRCAVSREHFYNASPRDFRRRLADPANVAGERALLHRQLSMVNLLFGNDDELPQWAAVLG